MVVLHLPFDIEHPAIRAGVQCGKEHIYQQDKPRTDISLTSLIKDFCSEDVTTLAYSVGFLIGLYIVESNSTQPQPATEGLEETPQ